VNRTKKLPKFRSQVLLTLPIMSQVSDGGRYKTFYKIKKFSSKMLFYIRLSSENISSPYDDRLDKNERLVVTIIMDYSLSVIKQNIVKSVTF